MRHLCVKCQIRPAKYLYKGRYRADKRHTLCLQCWRMVKARMASRKLKGSL